ncbi:MAG: bifunctional diaminohydroxyphosphoribosylaminopyrimidine deaminase/5-amino-6-(5-phosphoribosylamino)uracil reductase RibD, partial [Kiritimatiellia bacterium]
MIPKTEIWMREALTEARKGLGFTAPNPAVGAVLVKGGRIVGRGYHHRAGTPHAEPLAIQDAGPAAAKGATLVVTLEPCSTTGRMPPCTEAVIAAGIKKVIVGCVDPNPAHAGRGLDLLRAAGIEVESGVLEAECQDLIRAFAHLQLTGRPYVTLKLATTLDGRIADAKGRSKWISGPASREQVQALRRSVDAILVGTETVIRDNPSLLPRPRLGHRPLRIIPDRRGRIPLSRKVFSDGFPTLGIVGPEFSDSRKKSLEKQGVELLQVKSFSWPVLLKKLGGRGVQHILCEGGGQLAGSLIKAGLVQ